MNKYTLALQTISKRLNYLKSTVDVTIHRVTSMISRKHAQRDRGPRWQQLELPLSRTPVRRWHR